MFSASEHTDANGRVQVTVKLPDNLTRYRVMVVAVDQSGRQFGESDSNLVARLPQAGREIGHPQGRKAEYRPVPRRFEEGVDQQDRGHASLSIFRSYRSILRDGGKE